MKYVYCSVTAPNIHSLQIKYLLASLYKRDKQYEKAMELLTSMRDAPPPPFTKHDLTVDPHLPSPQISHYIV